MIPYNYLLDHFTFCKHMTSMSNAQEHWTAAGITSVMWSESVKLVSDLSDSTSSSSTCGNLFVLDHFWLLIKMVASWWWHCYFLNVYVYQYSWYLLFPPQHNLEVNLNIFIAFKLRHQSAENFRSWPPPLEVMWQTVFTCLTYTLTR